MSYIYLWNILWGVAGGTHFRLIVMYHSWSTRTTHNDVPICCTLPVPFMRVLCDADTGTDGAKLSPALVKHCTRGLPKCCTDGNAMRREWECNAIMRWEWEYNETGMGIDNVSIIAKASKCITFSWPSVNKISSYYSCIVSYYALCIVSY